MSLRKRMILMAGVLALTSGCQQIAANMDDINARLYKREVDSAPIRPGLEPLYNPRPEPPPSRIEASPEPVPLPSWALPFPLGRLDGAQAETVLAGDPMALRFLALKRLTEMGELPVDEAMARKDANLGALLPLTTEKPPATGLDRPIPPVAEFVNHYTDLGAGKGKGDDHTRAAERGFMLDALLPKDPPARQRLAPPDLFSARKLLQRLGWLEDAGLVSPLERARETTAVENLMAGGSLPEVLNPPQPPEPPKPKKSGLGRGQRMAGGVSGRLEIIPSPPGVTAPRLAAGAKGPAGVHLLSMGSAAHGATAWDALKKEHPELAELGYKVLRTDLGDLGVTYRLVAGPMDAALAEQLCTTLKPRGQTCTPTPFPAQ